MNPEFKNWLTEQRYDLAKVEDDTAYWGVNKVGIWEWCDIK